MTTTFGTISSIQFVNTRNSLSDSPSNPNKNVIYQQQGSRPPSRTSNSSKDAVPSSTCSVKTPNGYTSPGICGNKNFTSSPAVDFSYGILGGNWGSSPGAYSPRESVGSFVSRSRSSSVGSSTEVKNYDDQNNTLGTGLAIEESPSGTLRFATDRPHLVSMGSGRLSTSVTLHPINEGKTILGSGGMGVVPDIPVLGTGIEPEHCLLENEGGIVTLTPIASMVAIDGIRISSVTRLTQGCMVCLGRSNFFRFNHPAEAQYMKSILPNARISMAPIAFYPAVDNPEYFHMSAQHAGSGEGAAVTERSSSGATGEVSKENKPPVPPRKTPPSSLTLPNEQDSPKNFNDKVFKFEGLSTQSQVDKSPDVERYSSNGNQFVKKINQSAEDSSDSDVPPEIPPRSEDGDSLYVNSSSSTTCSVSMEMAESNSYLGEYIFTKAGVEPSVPKVVPGTTRVVGGAATVVSPNGMTTVHNALYRSLPQASPNNNSSSSPLQSPSHLSTSPNTSHSNNIFTFSPTNASSPYMRSGFSSTPLLASNPSYCLTSSMQNGSNNNNDYSLLNHMLFNHSPASATSGSLLTESLSSSHTASSQLLHSYMNTSSVNSNSSAAVSAGVSTHDDHMYFRSPPSGITYTTGKGRLINRSSSEDLAATQKKKQQAVEEREREEEAAAAEKARLEEILNMCAEYERQQKGEQSGGPISPSKPSTSPYHTLTQNRIKTNGSLPREKRSPLATSPPATHLGLTSPTGSLPLSPINPSNIRTATSPEDELRSIFSFDGDLNRSGSLPRNCNFGVYSPFPNTSPSRFAGSPSPPPVTPRSPYENVAYHGYPVPHSPRTRIRTTVGKDRREQCEIFENKMAVADFNCGGVISPRGKDQTSRSISKSPELPSDNTEKFKELSRTNMVDASPPPKPPRSPRIERSVLDGPCLKASRTGNSSVNGDESFCKASVIDNKYFAPVTPNPKSEKSVTAKQNTNIIDACGDRSSLDFLKGRCSSETTYHVDTKFKSKTFEEHMKRNIRDTLNINDVAGEIDRLQTEKEEALQTTLHLKYQIHELETQENESLRELEMERALVEGELRSTREKLVLEEEKLSELLRQSVEMEERHNCERKNDLEAIEKCKAHLEEAEDALEKIETNKDSEEFAPSSEEEKEILETLKARHETVDAERKIFEDTEFSQMESEALRESEREELNKEVAELKEKIGTRKEKIFELESQVVEMTSSVCEETEKLDTQRQELIALANKERMRVTAVDRQFGELVRLGVISPISGGQVSPTCSSDTEESGAGELSERLAKLHLLDRSQEDLDRINQVTITSPLDCRDSTLGRKTSATLMEIEKNRQLMLAKQGTQAIDQERKRVEELKRRVAQEVKLQWEEKKAKEQREVNCASLNSVGSEESSVASSDLPTESLSSEDVIGQRSSGESVPGRSTLKMRQRDAEISNCAGEQSRPLSEASSFCDTEGQPIKLRDKPRNQQRPLTRYLPVRAEEHFDLRQHIESAGHQIEQCPYVTIDYTSCRGYLHKLGSKFRTWQKRWFVFDRSKRALIYYSDKNEGKPRGGAYFQAIEEVYVDHLHTVKSPSPKLTFCVKTHDRTYQLMAPSPEAMRIWIDVIFTGAEGYHEFQGGT